jgi:hypothetical protein
MTDQPSIEQQLADVVEVRMGYNRDLAEAISRFIIVCVNDGRCPPIMPEGDGRFARTDPFLNELADKGYEAVHHTELAELRALKAKVDSLDTFPLASGTVLAYSDLAPDREFDGFPSLFAWLREASDG